MHPLPTLLAVFAHPDDESLVAGGTLARYAAAGVQVALVCATRGEWGPISNDNLANYETLGQVREGELRAACDVLGVRWLRWLDLPDGGVRWAMEDESYDAPAKLVRALREWQPQVVITFGPDGLYGHDDHLAIGQLTTAACAMAAEVTAFPQHFDDGLTPHQTARLYYASYPKGLMTALAERLLIAKLPGNLWDIAPAEFGIPAEEFTTEIDVRAFVSRKLAALRCHQTQMMADHALKSIPDDLALEFLGREYFRRVPDASLQPKEDDLFPSLLSSGNFSAP